MKHCDRKTLELLVLGCWAHEEISIGRARELLGWPDDKIREQAEKRVSNAVKLREERDQLESDRDDFERRYKSAKAASALLYRMFRQLALVNPLGRWVAEVDKRWPWLQQGLSRSESDAKHESGSHRGQ